MALPAATAKPVQVHGHARKLALLDLARALAAFWVLFAHLSILLNRRAGLWSEGRIPVDVFIFLSGFLMFYLLRHQQEGSQTSETLNFYLRRFFRIAPCFYCALLAYLLFRGLYRDGLLLAEEHFGAGHAFTGYIQPLRSSDVLAHFTFLHGFSQAKATRVFGPAWTLSLEMQFYAVAPFVAWWLKRRPATVLLGTFAVNAAAWLWYGSYGHVGWGPYHAFPSFLPDRLFLFCSGSAACLYHGDASHRHGWLLAACGVGGFLIFPLDSMLLCVLLTAGLLLIQRAPEHASTRGLQGLAASRPVGLAAEWSYALYLIHQFCFALAAWLLARWLVPGQASAGTRIPFALTATSLSVSVAAGLFFCVEKPLREFGKHLDVGAWLKRFGLGRRVGPASGSDAL